jgi:hypothetical protein
MATPINLNRVQRPLTRGVVYVHDSGKAFCKPLEWSLSGVLDYEVVLDWTPQPITPGRMRAELSWTGPAGTSGRIVNALRQLPELRFEVTEEPTLSSEGERYASTPSLGIYRAQMSVHGDVLINEQRIRTLLNEVTDITAMQHSLGLLLGTAWDAELEPFRLAGEGTPVRWLHRVG